MTFPRISSPPFLTSALPESKRIESTMLTVSLPLSSEIVICPFEISDFIFSSMLSYVELTFWTCSSLAFTRLAFSALSFAFSASRSATFLRSSKMVCERLSDFD